MLISHHVLPPLILLVEQLALQQLRLLDLVQHGRRLDHLGLRGHEEAGLGLGGSVVGHRLGSAGLETRGQGGRGRGRIDASAHGGDWDIDCGGGGEDSGGRGADLGLRCTAVHGGLVTLVKRVVGLHGEFAQSLLFTESLPHY